MKSYAQYNHWADERLANILQDQEESLLQKTVSSSFPSLYLTVLHLWDAQQIWLARLQGQSPQNFPSRHYRGTAEEAVRKWVRQSRDIARQMQAQPATYFSGTCRYQNTRGQSFQHTRAEVLMHLFNHASYHRGQLITLMRQLGIGALPATDYVAYLREV